MLKRLLAARPGGARLVPLVAAAALLAGCDEQLPPGPDLKDPRVDFLLPTEGFRVAAGDSVMVRVRVRDDQAIERVVLHGYSSGGSATGALPRFEPLIIDIQRDLVRDTTITRFLRATADTRADDNVFVEALVSDRSGRTAEARVAIAIGGPRVQLVSPGDGEFVQAGTQVPVRVSASDPTHRIASIVVRATGAVDPRADTITIPLRTEVDTTFVLALPRTVKADTLRLTATAFSSNADSAVSRASVLRVSAAAADTEPPRVTFGYVLGARVDMTDTLVVSVSATDNTQVDSVGASVFAIYRGKATVDTLAVRTLRARGSASEFRVPIESLNATWLANALLSQDSATLSFEVTAFAVDTAVARNCATAVMPGSAQSLPCRTGPQGSRVSGLTGSRRDVLVTRGLTIRLAGTGDRVADIASDGQRLFASNILRNRLEVMPVGARSFSQSIAVGSQPWGLAFSPDRARLYVANSGGTNISVVSASTLREEHRIQTLNLKVYNVVIEAGTASGVNPSSVTGYDYSDRPQFVGVTANENVVYSTRPTSAARNGTLRTYRLAEDRVQMITGYLERRPASRVLIFNAADAALIDTEPKQIRVCPRNRSADPALDRNLPNTCFTGSVDAVEQQILDAGYDTRFLWNREIEELGLQDTTFVAVSGDHRRVAFGEGGRGDGLARVFAFTDFAVNGGGPAAGDTTVYVKHGEIADLVGNAADRVVALSLNQDGSLGVARGNDAYFFTPDLRLQGTVETGDVAGGIALHPQQSGYLSSGSNRMSFVSGLDPAGLPYIDVVDTYAFCRVRRIFVRDRVIGKILALPRQPADPSDVAIRLYAVTTAGLVEMTIAPGDMEPVCR